ncbi:MULTISPECIES: 3-oxoacyl-[acyl-carrier-protein] reductase [unclassified Granulicatella]|uniref:3-oxoacyl-[acyl-carrier-protein] reductase n=1 Tax=unclassified Granulicatella TaxID=2630493 RepID=UPI00107499E1|nr:MULTISPECIES: 3-oxoacyl-[acyl-carrier-protein] reductase [unclassified Granulicatella]MBF0780892.1 3-oxoacyl-[acyl-carrier-protein] reductase [Granulicatella sp. 19428wC4_WM01]TFU93243.1 3-oxoacyl-[acyl-carrier-protein] reductase [Granulicatella sp. WM01]
MTLKDKVIFISGSSRGIGLGIARIFAQNGAHVVLNGRKEIASDIIQELENYGVKVRVLLGDVSSFEETKRMIATIKDEFGRLDILVNNAGITRDQLLLRMSEEDFDDVYAINLKGTFNLTKHAIALMLKQKSGTIINITSVVGLAGNAGQVNYASSKAGIIGLTKATAKEVAARGITCNAIAPGYIKTEMTQQLSEKTKESIIQSIPARSIGTVDDIAQAALYLAQAKYVTGQVLSVNGGMYM